MAEYVRDVTVTVTVDTNKKVVHEVFAPNDEETVIDVTRRAYEWAMAEYGEREV